MFEDIRDFIEAAEKAGETRLLEGADWNLEIGAITDLAAELPDPPILIFDRIKGYGSGYRVVTNLFATPKRTALAWGLPQNAGRVEMVRAMRDKVGAELSYLPPNEVDTGPVKENILTGSDVDLFKFPAPVWHAHDGGRYIGTGCVCVLKDPDDGWINLGTYRTQIQDKSTVTVTIAAGHRGDRIRKKYWAKGLNCPISICCGQDPTLWGAAQYDGLPDGVSEYDFAGGVRGSPIKTIRGVTNDLLIPATAEIVLEGEILPPEVETRNEGPFGEWCGYYAAGTRPMPAIRINAILHRDRPILQGNPPHRLPSVWSVGKHMQLAAFLWNALDRQVPGVKGVWMVEEAALYSIAVVSVQQSYPGHAKAAGLIAASSAATNFNNTFVIVVDDDIDPSNISQVLWALGTRVDPASSIDVVRGLTAGPSHPMTSPEAKRIGHHEMATAVIVACKPFHWRNQFPPSVEIDSALAKRIREKWKGVFALK